MPEERNIGLKYIDNLLLMYELNCIDKKSNG